MSCIASRLHYNYIFMHYRCVLYMLFCCVLLGLDWVDPTMFLSLHVTYSCIYTFISLYSYILIVWCFSTCLSFSLSISLFFQLVALWHLNENPFHPKTLFILGHFLPLTLLLLLFGSLMIKPERTFRRTSLDEAFIQNTKSFYRSTFCSEDFLYLFFSFYFRYIISCTLVL